MRARHFLLGLFQLLLICLSAWLRRNSWNEIDLESIASSSALRFSFFCLAGWLATIAMASWFALTDKKHRTMVVLLLVLVFPSVEFFSWMAFSF